MERPTERMIWESRPAMSSPVAIAAFRGWNDGGEGASSALEHLRTRWDALPIGRLDPEDFYDFQVSRPTVRLVEGAAARRIEWPTVDFTHARVGGRDVILVLGPEPNVRWRTFSTEIVEAVRFLGCELLVTLGAFLADVPHTMPAPVVAASADPTWLGRAGVGPATYEGPTGIVGVLGDAAAEADLPSVSLWAAAPHYLSGHNPKIEIALLSRLGDLLDLPTGPAGLSAKASAWEHEVSEAIEADDTTRAYVGELEQLAAERTDELGVVPSGEELASELERFLKERGGRGDGPESPSS